MHVVHRFLDPLPGLREDVEIVAEQLDADVAADAGLHLVHPILDRLRERDVLPRHVAEQHLQPLGQLRLRGRPRPGPAVARLQRYEHIRKLDAHRIGRDLGRSDPAPDVFNLLGERGQDRFLHLRVVADRLLDLRPRLSRDGDHDLAFRVYRQEVRSEIPRRQPRCRENQQREADHEALGNRMLKRRIGP